MRWHEMNGVKGIRGMYIGEGGNRKGELLPVKFDLWLIWHGSR